MNDRAIYANANALDLPIGDKSVHMIATSPPYWGLRSYDTGDQKHAELGAEPLHDCLAWARGDDPCGGCYVCNMRTWAREMKRVLRDDGTLWLNLGDSYTDKNLAAIPWRVALALQADGWYLRSDIIWAKPNPMPESVTDRPTKAHEYVFLLTKSARYYWDAEAVREEVKATSGENFRARARTASGALGAENQHRMESRNYDTIKGANIRTVWTIATAPYSGAHYATWPPALVERMVKAGSSERGVCPECGKPWERVVEHTPMEVRPGPSRAALNGQGLRTQVNGTMTKPPTAETTGWRSTCDHADAPVPAIVLDPFCGSGTTLMVARQLGRIGLGFDLSLKYLEENAAVRLGHDKLAAWGNGIKDTTDYSELALFSNGKQ